MPSPDSHLSRTALLVLLITTTLAVPVFSQPDPASVRIPVLVTARDGDPPRSLSASDLVLTANGTVLTTEVAAPSSRLVTLYVDSALSSLGSVRRAADRIMAALPPLLKEAELEIVVADPTPRVLLPATRRPDTARNALDRLFLTLEPEDAIEQLRRAYRASLAQRGVSKSAAQEARLGVAEAETAAVRRQHDQLLLWLDRTPAQEGQDRILVLVNDALDINTYQHYSANLPEEAGAARALLQATGAKPNLNDLATVAAARGWGIATFARSQTDDSGLQYAPDEDTPVGFRIRLGGTGRTVDADAEPERLFIPNTENWATLSSGSAGAVLGQPSGRRGKINATDDLLQLVRARHLARVPLSLVDADLTITSPHSGWTVATLPRVVSPAPRALAVARLHHAFTEGDEAGDDLAIDASLALGQVAGQRDAAELRVDLADLELAAGSPLRLSVAVHTQDELIAIQHYDRIVPFPPSAEQQASGTHENSATQENSEDPELQDATDSAVIPDPMIERIPLRLPPAADSVAVVVTDKRTGRWGLAFAEVDQGDRTATSAPTTADRPRAITLMPLSPGPKSGKIRIQTQVTDDVARVLFYLNGQRVGRRSRAPFDANINLGPRARTSQLVVAAFDRSGKELDRARMLINEPPQSFWVRITEPDPTSLATGPVEVAAELKVPKNASLESVDFYWKSRLLASATEPPFRRTLRVPLNEPDGFLRVEARLRDGRVAEDVLVTARAGFGETIGVELVELYVVATDRRGKPVQGLTESDFRVIEDGDPQTLESFTVAGDLPLTLGLAIDSSSSLFLKMPEVRRAAGKFVTSLRDGKDRAFLVSFGSEASLERSITLDLGAVARSIEQLEPYGATAVWGAISLSLEQLESVNGRRALVVFYDGDDEDRERHFERSMKLARRARLPVYLIVLNDEAARTSGRSLSSRSFANRLERIGRVGGGRVYFVGGDDALDPIFESISEELRSHYLLTYYPQLEPGGPLWRPVEVEITKRGIDARTVEGRELEP